MSVSSVPSAPLLARWLTGVVLLPLVGCAATGTPGSLSGVAVDVDPDVPTVADVSWQVGEPATSWVEYGLDGALDQSTPMVATGGGGVAMPVLGMKAGHTYSLRAVSELADGTRLESESQELTLENRPADLPSFDIPVDRADMRSAGGYVAMTIIQQGVSWLAIIDRDGDYVWWHYAGDNTLVPSLKASTNGTDLLYSSYDGTQEKDLGEFRRITVTTGTETASRTTLAHHDFAELPDGNIAWLAYATDPFEMEGEMRPVTGDLVLEAPEADTEHGKAATVIDLLHDWRTPSVVCDHVLNKVLGTGGMDWSHGNSLVYNEADDAFYVTERHMDALLKIDRASGDILWEMSPWSSDLVSQSGRQPWSHGHMSDAWNGGVLMFSNNDHDTPPVSAVVGMSIDEENGTYQEDFRYADPEDRFIQVLGDARRMPDGNVMSSWMSAGFLKELTPGGKVVWEADASVGSGIGRILFLDDLYDLNSTRMPE